MRGVAEKANEKLNEVAGVGNAENKSLEARDALVVFKTALGDKASGEKLDAVGLRSAGLAAAATNMRQFVAAMWKFGLGLGTFASGTEDMKMEAASKLSPTLMRPIASEREEEVGAPIRNTPFSRQC